MHFLKGEVLPALTYATYSAGWRYAPRLLACTERIGHRMRDRPLDVHVLRAVVGGVPFAVRTVTWDAAWREDLFARVGHVVGSTEIVREGRTRALALDPSVGTADMTFVEVPGFRTGPFVEAGYLVVPKRVSHVEHLDRPDPPLVRRIRRRMSARGLESTLTRDPREVAEFIRGLYRPFVTARHAGRARPTPALVLALVMRRGALLQVRERGTVVSGAIVATNLLDRATMDIVVIAARDAADEVARTAPVVLARDEARRQGKARCDHLGSSPFLCDGVYRRKRQYDTIPVDMSHRQDRFVVRIGHTPASRAVVSAEPFLVLEHGRLVDVRTLVAKEDA